MSGIGQNYQIASGIKCFQWNGENFKEIEDEVQANLTGYIYRKDDNLILDYNDGSSVKKISPLDWIFVNSEDNDLTVMSDKMFCIFKNHMAGELNLSKHVVEVVENTETEQKPAENQTVALTVNSKYGDKVEMNSAKNGGIYFKFSSYQGDQVKIEHIENYAGEFITSISMKDRYGNVLKTSGNAGTTKSNLASSSLELYTKMNSLMASSESKVTEVYDMLRNIVTNSKKIVIP